MPTCVICAKPATHEYEVISRSLGWVCDDRECGSLLWQSHLNEHIGASAEERAQNAWAIAQKRNIAKPRPLDPLLSTTKQLIARTELRLVEIEKQSRAAGVPLDLEPDEDLMLQEIVKKYDARLT